MDEQLRRSPDDVVALLRAGRLTTERVAMAAYLGDERALASGVEAWVPPDVSDFVRQFSWSAQRLLTSENVTQREKAWLACVCAEHAVDQHWPPGSEMRDLIQEVIERVNLWCREGKSQVGWRALDRSIESISPESEAAAEAAESVRWANNATSIRDHGRAILECLRTSIAAAGSAAGYDADDEDAYTNDALGACAAEQAWQAQAIADTLLDPNWPPWEG